MSPIDAAEVSSLLAPTEDLHLPSSGRRSTCRIVDQNTSSQLLVPGSSRAGGCAGAYVHDEVDDRARSSEARRVVGQVDEGTLVALRARVRTDEEVVHDEAEIEERLADVIDVEVQGRLRGVEEAFEVELRTVLLRVDEIAGSVQDASGQGRNEVGP